MFGEETREKVAREERNTREIRVAKNETSILRRSHSNGDFIPSIFVSSRRGSVLPFLDRLDQIGLSPVIRGIVEISRVHISGGKSLIVYVLLSSAGRIIRTARSVLIEASQNGDATCDCRQER